MNAQKHCERLTFRRGVRSERLVFDETWVKRVMVLTVAGEVDILTAPELADALRVARGRDPAALIVDLSDVTFLAVAGINELIAARRSFAPTEGFGVVADGPVTGRLLTMLGLDTALSTYRTLVDAVAGVCR